MSKSKSKNKAGQGAAPRGPVFRVLAVDDEPIALMIHREALAPSFDVITATSGQEALTL